MVYLKCTTLETKIRKGNPTMNDEKAKKELEQGKKESAATSVVNPSRGNTNVFGTIAKFLSIFKRFKMLLPALAILAIVIVGAWLINGNTYKKETSFYIEQVREIATLATAQAYTNTVIKVEDNKIFGKNIPINLPGTKREVLVIVPATITAGVDLKEITSKEIQINEKKKTMKITLPRATFLHIPAVNIEDIQFFSDEGLFRGEPDKDESQALVAEAQQQLEKEAIENGLLETAEKNAVTALENFFSNEGYTVTVQFK